MHINISVSTFCTELLSRCRSLMSGDKTGGFTIFYADDGLDTGPILLQKETEIDLNDTVDTFYNRFLYPEGIVCLEEF